MSSLLVFSRIYRLEIQALFQSSQYLYEKREGSWPQKEFFLLLVPCLCGSGTLAMAYEAVLLLRSFFWEHCSPKVSWLVFLIMDLAPMTDQVRYIKLSFPCSVKMLETLNASCNMSAVVGEIGFRMVKSEQCRNHSGMTLTPECWCRMTQLTTGKIADAVGFYLFCSHQISQNCKLFYFCTGTEKKYSTFTQKLSLSSQKYGFGIRDPEKSFSGSRIRGSKRHWSPGPDPQHCLEDPLVYGCRTPSLWWEAGFGSSLKCKAGSGSAPWLKGVHAESLFDKILTQFMRRQREGVLKVTDELFSSLFEIIKSM